MKRAQDIRGKYHRIVHMSPVHISGSFPSVERLKGLGQPQPTNIPVGLGSFLATHLKKKKKALPRVVYTLSYGLPYLGETHVNMISSILTLASASNVTNTPDKL